VKLVVQQRVALNGLDFRRLLPLCNLWNRFSRCCGAVRPTCRGKGMHRHAGGYASNMGYGS
jgi:hypothetical protein